MIIKSVVDVFGEGWRAVDLTVLTNIETRRDCLADGVYKTYVTVFTRAVNALTRSLCRTDRGYLRRYQDGEYQELKPGMFTLADLYAEFRREIGGKYVYDFSARSQDIMAEFFAGVDANAPISPTTYRPGIQDARALLAGVIKRAEQTLAMRGDSPHYRDMLRFNLLDILGGARQASALLEYMEEQNG